MRADLMALTVEAVAALSNMGLVKRAQREIAEGKGPALEELPDGTVIGRSVDLGKEIEARLIPKKAIKDCPCSCGATTVCRHRVAVALAYRGWQEGLSGKADPGAVSGGAEAADKPADQPVDKPADQPVDKPADQPADKPAPSRPQFMFWNPAALPADALAGLLGKKAMEDAHRQRRKGLVVEVRLPDAAEPHPLAKLPTCTVRFLVPMDLSYARCDCLIGQGCPHIALAVWAFAAIPVGHGAGEGGRLEWTVEVRDREEAARSWPSLEEMHGLARGLLLEGVVNARESLGQRFALVRAALEKEGMVWPLVQVEELEECITAYQRRSARYSEEQALEIVAGMAARPRALAQGGELPVKYLTGAGESMETKMDKVRLISLGARVEADGRDRTGRVFLADPDTGTVLVWEKDWDFTDPKNLPAKDDPPEGPALGGRKVATGTFAMLARGQIVTRVAKRRANRLLLLGQNIGGSISITPQNGDWSRLPAPLLVRSLRQLSDAWDNRPPLLLRPRLQAENLHAIEVSSVEAVAYDSGDQILRALLHDPEQTPFLLERPHRSVCPKAIDNIAAALAGAHGPVRYVSGLLRRQEGRFVLEVVAVVADRVVVPDLEEGEGAALPTGGGTAPSSATGQALRAARLLLQEGVHLGLKGLSHNHAGRAEEAAAGLEEVGMGGCALRLRTYGRAIRTAFAGDAGGWDLACQRWEDAAIRLMLVEEAAQ